MTSAIRRERSMRRLRMRYLKQLRRIGAMGAVVAAVTLAAPALAGAASYSGTINDGGTVSFKTVTRDGKIVRVKDFGWRNAPTTCDQGAFNYTAKLPFSISVKSLGFAINATGGGVVQAVSGRFTDHRRKAGGTLNIFGDLAAGHTSCATGNLRWSATRG
jgi:hypothetical protein